MSKIILWLKSKAGLFAAVSIAAVIGGASSGVVLAAIPDGSGTIHGCYDNKTGLLSVVDSAVSTCTSKQTALNWGQNGSGQSLVAYGYVICGGTDNCPLDAEHTSGVSNFTQVTAPDGNVWGCMSVASPPRFILENGSLSASIDYSFKDSSGSWALSDQTQNTNPCVSIPGDNVALVLPRESPTDLLFVVY